MVTLFESGHQKDVNSSFEVMSRFDPQEGVEKSTPSYFNV